jgi:hypothetical protein
MAAVAKVGTPSLTTDTPCDGNKLPPLFVGEDIGAGDPCCIKSDGKVWKALGTGTAGTTAEVDGWATLPAKVAQRQTISLYWNINLNYSTGMTPGTFLYLADAGGVQTTAGATQTKPIARVVDATRIRAFRSY